MYAKTLPEDWSLLPSDWGVKHTRTFGRVLVFFVYFMLLLFVLLGLCEEESLPSPLSVSFLFILCLLFLSLRKS